MNIHIRNASIHDYHAVEAIMRQVQQMHIDWRPDIYKHSEAVLPATMFEQAVRDQTLFVADCEGRDDPVPSHRKHKPGDKRCPFH